MVYGVHLPDEIGKRIDEVVKSLKDEYGLRRFRSRAAFATEACKRMLREVERGRAAGKRRA